MLQFDVASSTETASFKSKRPDSNRYRLFHLVSTSCTRRSGSLSILFCGSQQLAHSGPTLADHGSTVSSAAASLYASLASSQGRPSSPTAPSILHMNGPMVDKITETMIGVFSSHRHKNTWRAFSENCGICPYCNPKWYVRVRRGQQGSSAATAAATAATRTDGRGTHPAPKRRGPLRPRTFVQGVLLPAAAAGGGLHAHAPPVGLRAA
ncbi:hypothetical protein HPB51_015071 [Rhipicephalus microplus]|uniref:Uncharacterized protein n=1 Tax=Rhipicephalus microplus TaxID=6941 RepID=A0A9J6ETT7_RHIMP|nr:hypothetical protein HPB51_015071 [Rhipicephalus microplus]